MDEGMNASFTQTGGVRFGWFNASSPFATFSGRPDELGLSFFGRDYRFPKDGIRYLQKHEGIFFMGLRIDHTLETVPRKVVFWVPGFRGASEFEKLKARLEALGYEVRD